MKTVANLLVRKGLDISIKRVESQSSPRSRHDPLVVRLVDVLVDTGVVLDAMNPVDADIVENHVQSSGSEQPWPAIVADIGIKQALATDLSEEPRQRQDVDERDGSHGRLNFQLNLVLQESRVVFKASVENEVVRKRAENKV